MNLTIDNYRNKSSHREIDVLWFDHKIVSTEMIKEIIQWREWLEPENCTILYNDFWHRPKDLKYKSFFKFWKSSGNTKIPIWKLIAIEWYWNIIVDMVNNIIYYDNWEVFDYFLWFQFYDVYNASIDDVSKVPKIKWKMFELLIWLYYGDKWYSVYFQSFGKKDVNNPLDIIIKKNWKRSYVCCFNTNTPLKIDKVWYVYWYLKDMIEDDIDIIIRSKSWFSFDAIDFCKTKNIIIDQWVSVEEMVKEFNLKEIHKTIMKYYNQGIVPNNIIIDTIKRQEDTYWWYYHIINEKWDTIHLSDSYWDSAYDIIKHWNFSNSWLCIVCFYWATYDADTWYRTTYWFRIITTKWKCFADIGELSDIDLSWSRKDDDDAKDDFIQYMLQDKIELINGVAIVDTTSWFTLLNEEWTDILSKTYSNIRRCNNYFIAYDHIDLDDWTQIQQRSIIDCDWVIKVVNDINIPEDKMISWNTDFNIDDKDY